MTSKLFRETWYADEYDLFVQAKVYLQCNYCEGQLGPSNAVRAHATHIKGGKCQVFNARYILEKVGGLQSLPDPVSMSTSGQALRSTALYYSAAADETISGKETQHSNPSGSI